MTEYMITLQTWVMFAIIFRSFSKSLGFLVLNRGHLDDRESLQKKCMLWPEENSEFDIEFAIPLNAKNSPGKIYR